MIPIIVKSKINAKDSFDAIQQLAEQLYSLNLVKESFFEAVCRREEVYPTGLPIEGMGIAIPHTDPVHVIKSCFAIGKLARPINFYEMGNPEGVVPVELIILMGIKKIEDHLPFMKCILDNISSEDFIGEVRACEDSTGLKILFGKCLSEDKGFDNTYYRKKGG